MFLARISARRLPFLAFAPLAFVFSAGGADRANAQAGANGTVSPIDQTIRSERFVTPPDGIASAVLAPRYRNVTLSNLSPDKRSFLNEIGDGPVTMEVFAKPFHELGGVFIDFRANRNRSLTIRSNVGLEIRSIAGAKTAVTLPPGARISNATWSPDGRHVAFYLHTTDATHVWVADAATGKSRAITKTAVLATMVTRFEWSGDGKRIATVLIPEPRAPMPVDHPIPTGPQVKLAEEKDKNRLRTYASLMTTPYQQSLFEWHGIGQLALIDVATRAVIRVGRPALISAIDLAPDGKHFLVTRTVKPFSYVVPVSSFGTIEEIWDSSGKVLARVDEQPLNLGIDTSRTPNPPGVGGGDGGIRRREIVWREDGRGLSFLEQDPTPSRDSASAGAEETTAAGGRGRHKDRLMQWAAPFGPDDLKALYETDSRMTNHRFSPDHGILFVTERTGQTVHEYAVVLGEPTKKLTMARYRSDDVYANPGTLVLREGTLGSGGGPGGGGGFGATARPGEVVETSADGQSVYYYGTKHDKNPLTLGPRTFIDRVTIRTGQKTRLYESDNAGVYERVLAFQDLEAKRLVVSRESETEVPQSFLRDGEKLTQLTENKDYTPDLTKAPKESFIVERPDGFKFKVNVTLPPDYRPGTRLPAMFWFYPREFSGQDEYDRGARTFNKNAFPSFNPRSIQYLARLGYAVVEPDAPIVGPAGQQNNNYENDLRNNLAAVIDEVDRRGLVDRTRIGIGGHSYGAFSTVNAMVHTPFFKAGIAGDGNYNRTLTPLNFQSERRDIWEARETYLNMSPLLFANNLTGALLLYHGLGDQNVGTDPTNSPRLFHALNGLGKTTSMYLYPFEDHGPATKETLLDLWGRWSAWLEKYVRHPTKPESKPIS